MEFSRRIRLNKTTVFLIVLVFLALVMVYLLMGGGDKYNDHDIKISQLLAASIHLAEKAGQEIVEIRKSKSLQETSKLKEGLAGKEIVTLGDQKSHNIITRGLKEVWPTLRTKSEEKTQSDHDKGRAFRPLLKHPEITAKIQQRNEKVNSDDIAVWIDPLDATKEYTEGGTNPELLKYVTVMVCITVSDEPIASVIHQPFVKDTNGRQGITYWAWVDHGVSPNLEGIKSSPNTNTIRVISSRSHSGDVIKVANSALSDSGNKVEHIVAAGAGYKTLQVALQKADLYLHTTPIKKWDICAGDALIYTLDGVMTTRKGHFITYDPDVDAKVNDGLIVAYTKNWHSYFFSKFRKFQ
ncbi:PREDICTED: putative inositol monophosphatase 3 isoform X1 [Amphimedon queenslandica]|uniref:inositol-phosphate phosphatase n=1 Tax=Amphimedon queenslandica TaxID=400682 RepID=A0AAN0JBE9_AMPQE|nr:PREDICTED: putative inositol monophosphatase 3 isoform X1 [Amphimedon queenslandica]|eukprot:XP_019854107.1 PREDICTED: putative inositol monophosphatase 3 isoform X1 [Amphimedon queenslandica]